MSGLEPEELARLLTEAVEPIRPSPDAYRQIRAGIDRRRRWRLPLMTAGGMVMAALIGLAVVALRPPPSSNELVEPAVPPLVTAPVTGPSRTPVAPSTGGTGRSARAGGGSGGGAATWSATTPPTALPSTSVSSPPVTAGSSASPTTVTQDSPQLPTAVVKPAVAGDVDGDGRSDQVRATGSKLEVVFSRDGTVGQVDLGAIVVPLHYTVVDIDANGFGEILVQTTSRSGMDNYALVRYASLDTLASVSLPAQLTLAAGVQGNVGAGFRCMDRALRINSGTSTDGSLFTVATTILALTPEGLAAQDSRSDQVRLPADPATSPFVAACGQLS
ncbi:hypothetical protein ThrDRAFT_01899 [Frankia casuarinae]|uniref:Uncharacterized protein n=1 Tax=Frankia casuarinae (strain DSM 45818 / CECT 9043 / HFP020203 / CcI3) TaxID=106370 RepID=Q2J6Q2_FRACC|nr:MULTISPECIES: VCBS repeat-containing protein [Frankia]ABD13040.1 hypothetical protein Francci3_3688 [Frankia casuarinae]EYT92450.1 hypothetical protein ThrDRAFT_01899 [Frankia casuarinae]KEZ35177.1 hypothetical protein CEDDRAFT_03429 [Frankia sp. CeD]OFB43266.1 hypothetical protein Manayef4_12460 [Frankia sp. CgIM4]